MDESYVAAPSLRNHEIIEKIGTSEHHKFDEEWDIEYLFLLWSTEKHEIISIDEGQNCDA